MTRPVLYSFRRCPYAMRARMALWIAGVSVDLREVHLKAKPAAMIEASPKGTVPVLDLGADGVIDESLAVMDWALAQKDPEGWRAVDRDEQTAMDALIAENDGPFKHHLDRYKYATRYDGADPLEHREAGAAFLAVLETRLTGSHHLFGPTRRKADVALFPFVRQFRIADPTWFDAAPFPRLQAWLKTHTDSALFAAVMVKHDPWQPGDAAPLFPAP